jgi:hypothetical protein
MRIDSGQSAGMSASANGDGLDSQWAYAEDALNAEELADGPRTGLVGWSYIASAIKRRKRLWIATAVTGFLAGSFLFVTAKPTYQVTVSILMNNGSTLDPSADVLIAESPAFAQDVVTKLGLEESVNDFLGAYSAADSGTDELAITATAPSAAVATSRANIMAAEYLKFRAGVLQDQLTQMEAAARNQVDQAQAAFNAIKGQLATVTAEPASAARTNELATLQSRLAAADDQLQAAQGSAGGGQANDQINYSAMVSGSQVINTSVPTLTHSRKKTALEYVGGGLFGGFMIGALIIAVGAVTSIRLRRRDDIAAALGAPVRVSVMGYTKKALQASRRKNGGSEALRVVEYLRRSLPRGVSGTASLAVVAVDNVKTVASLVAELGETCARDGQRVMLADLAGGALADLFGEAEPGLHTVSRGDVRLVLAVPDRGDETPLGPLSGQAPHGVAAAYSGADVLITLATLDPAVGGDHLGTWATNTVAVVTAGLSSGMKVQAAGEMIKNGGARVVSGVLLGADKSDESLGV